MKVAHVKGLKNLIKFFFVPYPPERMVVLYDSLDNGYCFYDDDIKIIDKDIVSFKNDEQSFTVKIDKEDFLKSFINVSIFQAFGPRKVLTPFSLGWRWVVFFAIILYLLFANIVFTIYPEPKEIIINGKKYKVLPEDYQPPLWRTVAAFAAFSGGMIYFIVTIIRMQDPTIKYAAFVLKRSTDNFYEIEPIPVLSNFFPIPNLTNEKNENPKKIDLVAKFNALLEERDLLRKQAVEYAKIARDMKKHSILQLRLEAKHMKELQRWAFVWLIFLIIGIIIGISIGWFLGSTFSITATPPNITSIGKAFPGIPGNISELEQYPIKPVSPYLNATTELEQYPIKPVPPKELNMSEFNITPR